MNADSGEDNDRKFSNVVLETYARVRYLMIGQYQYFVEMHAYEGKRTKNNFEFLDAVPVNFPLIIPPYAGIT